MRRMLLATALCLGVAGCATTSQGRATREQIVESQVAIRTAEGAGAEQVPEAARYLGFARQQVGEGEQLLAEGKPQSANLVLQQATADAELALALAREAPLRAETQRMRESAKSLRQQDVR